MSSTTFTVRFHLRQLKSDSIYHLYSQVPSTPITVRFLLPQLQSDFIYPFYSQITSTTFTVRFDLLIYNQVPLSILYSLSIPLLSSQYSHEIEEFHIFTILFNKTLYIIHGRPPLRGSRLRARFFIWSDDH